MIKKKYLSLESDWKVCVLFACWIGCFDKILKVEDRLLVECMMKKELFVWFVVE
jgi:hypothetical protein